MHQRGPGLRRAIHFDQSGRAVDRGAPRSAAARPSDRPAHRRARTSAAPAAAAAAAWRAEATAYYRASADDDPSSPALTHRLVAGSPAAEQVAAFLTAQASSGVVGPATWQLGAARVVRLAAGEATVTGCSYDTGSRLRSSGAAAPASLGGGAGLTAYVAELREVGPTWLVDRSVTSAAASRSVPGPCHGFVVRSGP